MLGHWPVQLILVTSTAPFPQDANLVLAVDCVPSAYVGFHQDFLKDHSRIVVYPKLDGFRVHLKKLVSILSYSSVGSLAVVYMEVPCCFELVHMAR